MNAEKNIQKSLESYTPARVSLRRTGHSLATSEILNLQLANAQARDAVHATLDIPALIAGLARRKLAHLVLASAAKTRADYLRNPRLGRALSPNSIARLKAISSAPTSVHSYDVAFVIADGLSALAVDRHALPLLDAMLALLGATWRIAPIYVVEQARVALADPIGETLGVRTTVILIGERPGLSSPDSLGPYRRRAKLHLEYSTRGAELRRSRKSSALLLDRIPPAPANRHDAQTVRRFSCAARSNDMIAKSIDVEWLAAA